MNMGLKIYLLKKNVGIRSLQRDIKRGMVPP
jgi:hypothetical protein